MITDCFGVSWWDMSDTEPKFIDGTARLLMLAIPAGIGFALFKLLIQSIRRRKRTPSILGLADHIEIGSRDELLFLETSRVNLLNVLSYLTTAIVAFDVGYLSLVLRQLLFG